MLPCSVNWININVTRACIFRHRPLSDKFHSYPSLAILAAANFAQCLMKK